MPRSKGGDAGMKRMNIILSPHLDDAVLSLGGLLAREGADSIVASFFAGAPATALQQPWDTACGFINSDHAIRERIDENQKALAWLGTPRTHIRDYPYLDVEYRKVPDYEGTREQEIEAGIAEDIAALVEENHEASQIRVFAPGLEMHGDHTLV